jgi:hypothetical protein
MQLEQRQHGRQRTAGKITLSASGLVLAGELFDFSRTGMALVLEQAPDFEISPDIQWLCQVDSSDFPTMVSFPARIVRQQELENGFLLGCELCL